MADLIREEESNTRPFDPEKNLRYCYFFEKDQRRQFIELFDLI